MDTLERLQCDLRAAEHTRDKAHDRHIFAAGSYDEYKAAARRVNELRAQIRKLIQ